MKFKVIYYIYWITLLYLLGYLLKEFQQICEAYPIRSETHAASVLFWMKNKGNVLAILITDDYCSIFFFPLDSYKYTFFSY